MTFDGRKGLEYHYNYLNLLEKATSDTTSVSYTWLADGTKAAVVDQDGNGYVYLGSLIYKRLPDGTLELEGTNHGSGRIVVKRDANGETVKDANGKPVYETQYHITDHLGSVRVVINQDGEVLARNDYYPFGKQHDNPALTAGLTNPANQANQVNPANPEANRFLFNGKEKQLTGNLGLLDYGARMYDPELGRWFNPDPQAEQRTWLSPYNFVQNNPLIRLDPDGMLDDWYFNLDGIFLGQDDATTNRVNVIKQEDWNDFSFNEDGVQTIDKNTGASFSKTLSKSGVSESAAMKIINHFNETGEELISNPDMDADFMVTSDPKDNADGSITIEYDGIQVNTTRVTSKSAYDHGYNIKSAIEHEDGHIQHLTNDPEGFRTAPKKEREAKAIEYQKSTPTWEKTTRRYKTGVQDYYGSYK